MSPPLDNTQPSRQAGTAPDAAESQAEVLRENRVRGILAEAGRDVLAAENETTLFERTCKIVRAELLADSSDCLLLSADGAEFRLAAGTTGEGHPLEEIASGRPLFGPYATCLPAIRRHGYARRTIEQDSRALDGKAKVPEVLLVGLWNGDDLVGCLSSARWSGELSHSETDLRILIGLGELTSRAMTKLRITEALRAANQLKSDFMATLSHEFRTPLHVILGYLELLTDHALGPVTEAQKDALDRIRRTTHSLFGLVEQTLDLNRLESQQTSLQIKTIQMDSIFKEIEHEMHERFPNPRTSLHFELEGNLSNFASDPRKIHLILMNLVGNAMKFTTEGEVRVCVAARTGGLQIMVEDTGPGIPEDERERIFQSFEQGDAAMVSAGGLGLGLYISRRLVELLSGALRLRTHDGKGSTFVVWLPSLTHAPRTTTAGS